MNFSELIVLVKRTGEALRHQEIHQTLSDELQRNAPQITKFDGYVLRRPQKWN